MEHSVVDASGTRIPLPSLWRDRPVFLIFYPGDFTPVCTRQLCSYRDRWQDFAAQGLALAGINPGETGRKQAFAGQHGFPFPLYSDPDQSVCRAYGAKAWYGTRRLAVLVDRDGRERWRKVTWPFLRPGPDALLEAAQRVLKG